MPIWGLNISQLDKLLTLSCTSTISSLLASALLNPTIPSNLHGPVLNFMRGLSYLMNLTLAAWTGTVISFIQEPVCFTTYPPAEAAPVTPEQEISRADECRLLFLAQTEFHTYPPQEPCAPFGTTAVVDCALEAQE
ncbi:hypothetical protein C8A05DRAFT_31073 [Staphylotrichum tortipilum]|uniref:Uncharacterized protein n=1 Tax=Staphylotrichum tortipilum TaxID=2831512 RepID=A0AAN6MQC6_9PEZI|nr:hypothetical protein C8A05DRAFT_31073 [Staphylotrichum longicolle]